MTMALKQYGERVMTRKISKNETRRYQINASTALTLFKDILIVLLRGTEKFKESLLKVYIFEMTKDLSSSLIDPPCIERIIRDITNKFPGNKKHD